MKTLTPDQLIQNYTSSLWMKCATTKIKIINESDMQKEASFVDREGRTHDVIIGRCICVGAQGERWTCSVQSLQRDRYPVTEEDSEGYREYALIRPQCVAVFDIPFPFTLQHNGLWHCDDNSGGFITWNGVVGTVLVMRVVMRSAFMLSYSPCETNRAQTRGEQKTPLTPGRISPWDHRVSLVNGFLTLYRNGSSASSYPGEDEIITFSHEETTNLLHYLCTHREEIEG